MKEFYEFFIMLFFAISKSLIFVSEKWFEKLSILKRAVFRNSRRYTYILYTLVKILQDLGETWKFCFSKNIPPHSLWSIFYNFWGKKFFSNSANLAKFCEIWKDLGKSRQDLAKSRKISRNLQNLRKFFFSPKIIEYWSQTMGEYFWKNKILSKTMPD